MNSSRNKNQETALQIIYSFLLNNNVGGTLNYESVLEDITELPFNDIDTFVKYVTLIVVKNQNEIEEKYIIPNLTKWTIDRIPLMSRAILLLAVAHYYYIGKVDKAVIIDIAVNQAKRYLDDKEYGFIHAILDNILK